MTDNNPFAAGGSGVHDDEYPTVYNPFEAMNAPEDAAPAVAVKTKSKSKKKQKNASKKSTDQAKKPLLSGGGGGGVEGDLGGGGGDDDDDDPWNDPPAAVVAAKQQADLTRSDLLVREENLARRQAEIEAREARLEENARLAGVQGLKAYNWPFSCWAFAYHNIDEQVLPLFRSLVNRMYLLMLFTWLTLFWNWITIFARWVSSNGDGSGTEFLWSSVFLVMGIPGSWLLWYRPLYFGCSKDSTIRWGTFLFNFMVHCVFCLLMAVGIIGFGGAGFIVMIDLFSHKDGVVSIFGLFACLMWLGLGIISCFMLKEAYSKWREGGGQAKAEKDIERAEEVAKLVY